MPVNRQNATVGRVPVSGWFVPIGISHTVALLTLLAFGASWHWYLETLGHFRVQYLVVLVICGTLFWLAGKWKQAVHAVLLASVNLMVVLPLYRVPPTVHHRGGSFTAVAANVQFSNQRRGRLLDYVRRTDPDWLALLEITPSWGKTLRPLEMRYPFSLSVPRPGGFGMALFSRYPWSEARAIPLGDAADYCLRVRTRHADSKWTLFVVHTASPISSQRVVSRNHQLRCLADLVQRETDPVVIVGDLNTTSWSPAFADLLSRTRLLDSRQGWGVQPSWPSGNSLFGIPIDHCLVSSRVAVLNRKVGNDIGSDHLPVFVELAFRR